MRHQYDRATFKHFLENYLKDKVYLDSLEIVLVIKPLSTKGDYSYTWHIEWSYFGNKSVMYVTELNHALIDKVYDEIIRSREVY